MEKLPVFKLTIKEDEEAIQEVNAVALVDVPAIGENFFAFKKEYFVEPGEKESESEFISRCIEYVMNEGTDQEQAAAICYSKWENRNMSAEQMITGDKISFDYDGVLSTDKGKELAKSLIDEGKAVYIISARGSVDGMLSTAEDLGISKNHVFATGSNKAKIEKVKELGITTHIDNNPDVISALGSIGQKFAESYSDYPKEASENAKIALRWADENGWGSCGTPVGKARANQLAKGEAITRDTIARMAAFERHRQNSQKELGDGCGRLMWLAWGGDAGIEWAQRKLKHIDQQKFHFSVMNEEERIVIGPAMIPDLPIYRKDETGEYYVFFDKKTIETIALKFYQKGFQQNANEMHAKAVEGITFFQSWIADESKGIPKMKQFENLPDGTWFLGAKVNNDETWAKVKDGTFRGFSVEGMFDMTEIKMRKSADEIIERLKFLLKDL